MGTRHLIAVQLDGEYKVAQYGQFDGYPEGAGCATLRFLHEGDIEALKRNLVFTYEPSDEDMVAIWAEIGHDIAASKVLIPTEKYAIFDELYPTLHRNTSAGVLDIIASNSDGKRIPLKKEIEFAGDSLFCEWAYVIDFDAGTFEVYKGYNKEAPAEEGERFHDVEWNREYKGREGESFYQVRLAAKWDLNQLPSEVEFVNLLLEA